MPDSVELVIVAPPVGGVYRIAHTPAAPFAPPSWDYAHDDGTFGNRFDDPSAATGLSLSEPFRMIYCATQRAAAFGETVAHFRPSITLLASLAAIEDDESLVESLSGAVAPNDSSRGLISTNWRLRRQIGHTVLDPTLRFVDIADVASLQHLRRVLAPVAAVLGLIDVDLSSVTSQQRLFTQACARYIYEQSHEDSSPRYAGIRYPSRLNGAWECWAIFDDRLLHQEDGPSLPEAIRLDDRDLMHVASVFDLAIEVLPGH